MYVLEARGSRTGKPRADIASGEVGVNETCEETGKEDDKIGSDGLIWEGWWDMGWEVIRLEEKGVVTRFEEKPADFWRESFQSNN